MDARLEVTPYEFAAAERLAAELGCSHVLAQVLVRRGLGEPETARAFLAAGEAHPLEAWPGLDAAADGSSATSASRITVHGDYDVDGICSTAILVRALRTLGARRRLVPAEPDRRRVRARPRARSSGWRRAGRSC